MNKYTLLFLLSLLFGNSSLLSQYTVSSVPSPKGPNKDNWVVNPDAFLDANTVSVLEDKLSLIESISSAEVTVVVLNQISGATPHDFGVELFNRWGVGKKETNNGLMILMVMDQRRVEFITGYGMESTLPDALCYDIQQRYMVPAFKAGNYDQGIIAGVDAVAHHIVGPNWVDIPSPEQRNELQELIAAEQAAGRFPKELEKNYFIGLDSLLTDSIKTILSQEANRFADSLQLPIFFFYGNHASPLSAQAMAYGLKKQYSIDADNHLIISINNTKNDLGLSYQMNSIDMLNHDLLDYAQHQIQQELERFGLEKALLKTYSSLDLLINDATARNAALEFIESQKKSRQQPAIYDYPQSTAHKSSIEWQILWIYCCLLLVMLVLTLVFMMIAQFFVKNPYQQYHTLTFFSLQLWIYLFPIPFLLLYGILKRVRQQYRTAPRTSKKTGQAMRLLSEAEEDRYLKAGQITEERINSIHYDVWITADEKDLLVLPYRTIFSKYSRCSKCSFRAYFMVYNRTITSATTSSTGLGEKKYHCKHCGHTHRYTYVIPKISESSSSGSGSSGGSFGGGSSGGGGAGSSW